MAFSPTPKPYNPYAFLMNGSGRAHINKTTGQTTGAGAVIQKLRGKLEELAHERLAYKQAMLLTCKLLERYTSSGVEPKSGGKRTKQHKQVTNNDQQRQHQQHQQHQHHSAGASNELTLPGSESNIGTSHSNKDTLQNPMWCFF